MSDKQPDPAKPPEWLDPLIWMATGCIGILILAESLGFSEPWLRAVLIVGVCIAGTGIVIVQAKRICPHCGAKYGYHLRILNQNTCRKCGGEFPSWPPDRKPE